MYLRSCALKHTLPPPPPPRFSIGTGEAIKTPLCWSQKQRNHFIKDLTLTSAPRLNSNFLSFFIYNFLDYRCSQGINRFFDPVYNQSINGQRKSDLGTVTSGYDLGSWQGVLLMKDSLWYLNRAVTRMRGTENALIQANDSVTSKWPQLTYSI